MTKKCEKHNRYRGIRKPRSSCLACWEIYRDYHQITDTMVASDKTIAKKSEETKTLNRKYKVVLERNRKLEEDIANILAIRKEVKFSKIKSQRHASSEATAIIVASDWHFEEEVKPETINNLNAFNLRIAETRSSKFFQNALTLLRLTQKDIKIENVVLALLGDFISNTIHEELAETNQLLPVDAVIKVQNILISGIKFLLDNTKCNLTIVCHSGNHGRITAKKRHSTESGNSLEYYMYHSLALHFKNNKRAEFIISPGYHTYLSIYDMVLRFHHGHDIRYQGGVGGIYIPLNKAISQWNKGYHADLDVMAHFHQFRDGGNFICNGSLIGYNAYALSIKAEFEKPRQAFFLIDKKRGKTIVAPILVDQN